MYIYSPDHVFYATNFINEHKSVCWQQCHGYNYSRELMKKKSWKVLKDAQFSTQGIKSYYKIGESIKAELNYCFI